MNAATIGDALNGNKSSTEKLLILNIVDLATDTINT